MYKTLNKKKNAVRFEWNINVLKNIRVVSYNKEKRENNRVTDERLSTKQNQKKWQTKIQRLIKLMNKQKIKKVKQVVRNKTECYFPVTKQKETN